RANRVLTRSNITRLMPAGSSLTRKVIIGRLFVRLGHWASRHHDDPALQGRTGTPRPREPALARRCARHRALQRRARLRGEARPWLAPLGLERARVHRLPAWLRAGVPGPFAPGCR